MSRCARCRRTLSDGYTLKTCPDCLRHNAEGVMNTREARKKEHKCVMCGVQLPEDYKLLTCKSCLERQKRANEKYYMNNREFIIKKAIMKRKEKRNGISSPETVEE